MVYKTADLFDQHGDNLQVADSIFTNYGGRSRFHGRIYTLRVFEDFLLIKQTLQGPGDQRVLVVDGGGSRRCALLGDRLAEMAVKNSWAGVIINGCIRDSEEVAELAIGVKALATCPARPSQDGTGERRVDLVFAGVTFTNGDYVYADIDGIVVSPILFEP